MCVLAQAECGVVSFMDCGHVRTPDCGGCGDHAACDGTAHRCFCDMGFSGDGQNCTVAIGTGCPNGNGSPQGCPAGQVCVSVQGVNVCNVVGCTSDADCGTNGPIPNSCGATPSGPVCQPNCDPSVLDSCNNPALVCLPARPNGATVTSQCAVNCTVESAGWCAKQLYGGVCGSSGVCHLVPCRANADCASNEICFPDRRYSYADMYCVPDCRTQPITCPEGWICDSTNGTCDQAAP